MNEIQSPPAPCGYCRRCAIHDDPGGCLTVEAWERENPEAAIASIQAAGMAGGQWRVDELLMIIDARREAPFDADPADYFEMGDVMAAPRYSREEAIAGYVAARAALTAAEEKAEAAFMRWFTKAQNGEKTNAAQAMRLSNEVSYLSADLSSWEGYVWDHDIDPETVA